MSKGKLLAGRRMFLEKLEPRHLLSAASADFDGSLLVDGGDLSAWEQGFGSTSAVFSQGDADLDGDVDGSDFLAWQRNFDSFVAVTSLEAEDATLFGNFVVASDAAASGGQFIHVPDGLGNGVEPSGGLPDEPHRATFTFNVAVSGTYQIEGGVYTPSPNGENDSFYVRVDGGASYLWAVRRNTSYQADYVNDRGVADPVQVFLGEGPHTVDVYLREDGTRLDYLELELQSAGSNTAPTDLALSGNTISETSINGTVVGTVTTTDPNLGETFSYLLTDNAGGRFAIGSGSGQLTVADGTLLDFDTAASHSVTVQVTDSANNTYSEAFTIDVTELDLSNAPIDFSAEIAARVSAGGTVRVVNSTATFNSAVSASSPGDVVLLADGVYIGGTSYFVNTNGLLITAQNLGGVTFEGGARLLVSGDNNTIGGFDFENLSQPHSIEFRGASNNRFTDNRFVNSGPPNPQSRMILVLDGSNGNRIDHNDFAGNRAFGLVIDQPGSSAGTAIAYSFDNRIDHNVFRDILDPGQGESRIPIQIGNGDFLLEDTRTLVDHNEFRDLGIRGSIINSKSSGITYLNNRFINIPGGHLSLRSGNNILVEGNFFDNVRRGVTVVGANITVINNVIVNSQEAGILIHNWGTITSTFYIETRDILIANNTIIDSQNSAIEIGRNWGSPPTATNPTENLRVINNIFLASVGDLVDLRTTQINFTLENNLYYATGSATNGDIGLDGQAILGNPNLTPTYELSASSTLALDSGVTLPEVTSDFDGNARTGAYDVGAYEFGSVPAAGASSSTASEDFSAMAGINSMQLGPTSALSASSPLSAPLTLEETTSQIAVRQLALDQAYQEVSQQRDDFSDLASNRLSAQQKEADQEIETQLVDGLFAEDQFATGFGTF